MIYTTFPYLFFFISLFTANPDNRNHAAAMHTKAASGTVSMAEAEYRGIDANNFDMPSIECFTNAVEGFENLKAKGMVKRNILTIADFSKSSNTKRLWVIDMDTKKVLFNTLVAHGRKTGDEFANNFSNSPESNMSSLGFYTTGDVYNGKHGMSLKLNGLEKGFNSNALGRAVVMHGADYVSESFIRQNHRLGRSLGCPAIPCEMVQPIISTIKGQSCLYIYHPSHCKKPQPQPFI